MGGEQRVDPRVVEYKVVFQRRADTYASRDLGCRHEHRALGRMGEKSSTKPEVLFESVPCGKGDRLHLPDRGVSHGCRTESARGTVLVVVPFEAGGARLPHECILRASVSSPLSEKTHVDLADSAKT